MGCLGKSGGLGRIELFAQPLPMPWQQFVEAGLRQVGDTGEHVGEPDERIDIVEFTCRNEGKHHCGAITAAIRAHK